MNYYIGIDGGGTKTAFACFNADGNCVIEIELASCHILQVSKIEAVSVLKKGIHQIKKKLVDGDKCFICAGLAGYGKNIEVRKMIEEVCETAFMGNEYIIYNDSEIAHVGALNGEDGILMIAGTGSIALARIKDEWMRCGGWGYMLGDEGSAYWIARKLLQEYTMQCDGRHSRTTLVDVVKKACNLEDDYDIIRYVHSTLETKRDRIATLARINYELAQNGDIEAIRIYKESAEAIAEIINTLAKKFNDLCIVSYVGGVWNAGQHLIEPLKKILSPNVQLKDPMYSPVYGAYLLALKKFKSQ